MSFFVAKLRFSWYIGAKQIKETILVNKKEKAKAVIEILDQNGALAALPKSDQISMFDL